MSEGSAGGARAAGASRRRARTPSLTHRPCACHHHVWPADDQVLGTFAKFLSGALQSMGKWDDLQATAWGKFVDATKGLAVKVRALEGLVCCASACAREARLTSWCWRRLVWGAAQVYAEQGSA